MLGEYRTLLKKSYEIQKKYIKSNDINPETWVPPLLDDKRNMDESFYKH
jgi:hypothetical protein